MLLTGLAARLTWIKETAPEHAALITSTGKDAGRQGGTAPYRPEIGQAGGGLTGTALNGDALLSERVNDRVFQASA